MDNAQKAIMIGVGLFITIIIIAAVMLITGMGQNLLNKGTDKLSGFTASLTSSELEEFDNQLVNGAKVVATIKKYWSDGNVVIFVQKDANNYRYTTPLIVNSVNNTTEVKNNDKHSTDTITNYSSVNGNFSIPASSMFKATLIKLNDTVVGVSFVKQ